MAADPYFRIRYLHQEGPQRALKRLAALKVEAESLGAPVKILSDPDAFTEAWNRAIETAQLEAVRDGKVSSLDIAGVHGPEKHGDI